MTGAIDLTAPPPYRAERHLAFACIALLHAPLSANAWSLVESFLAPGHPWSVELELISRLLPLCFAAFIAWLAFDRFDTGSDVWFIMALIYGYAFQRTRSIAVPVALHATSLVLHHCALWLFAP